MKKWIFLMPVIDWKHVEAFIVESESKGYKLAKS